jgi:hypothetical protein
MLAGTIGHSGEPGDADPAQYSALGTYPVCCGAPSGTPGSDSRGRSREHPAPAAIHANPANPAIPDSSARRRITIASSSVHDRGGPRDRVEDM